MASTSDGQSADGPRGAQTPRGGPAASCVPGVGTGRVGVACEPTLLKKILLQFAKKQMFPICSPIFSQISDKVLRKF